MLLGYFKPEMDWPNKEQILEKIPSNYKCNTTRNNARFPKGEEYRSLQRDLKRALDNLERQVVGKQLEDVSGRRRKLSLFHRVHGVYELMSFENSLVDVIKRLGPKLTP